MMIRHLLLVMALVEAADYVRFYQRRNFRGRTCKDGRIRSVKAGSGCMKKIGNNRIAALKVCGNRAVTLYDNADYSVELGTFGGRDNKGGCWTYKSGQKVNSFDAKKVSSYKIVEFAAPARNDCLTRSAIPAYGVVYWLNCERETQETDTACKKYSKRCQVNVNEKSAYFSKYTKPCRACAFGYTMNGTGQCEAIACPACESGEEQTGSVAGGDCACRALCPKKPSRCITWSDECHEGSGKKTCTLCEPRKPKRNGYTNGYYLKNNQCKECTYCISTRGQITDEPCTATSNTKCKGCPTHPTEHCIRWGDACIELEYIYPDFTTGTDEYRRVCSACAYPYFLTTGSNICVPQLRRIEQVEGEQAFGMAPVPRRMAPPPFDEEESFEEEDAFEEEDYSDDEDASDEEEASDDEAVLTSS